MLKRLKLVFVFSLFLMVFLVGCDLNTETDTYTVSFNTNGGTSVYDLTVDAGTSFLEPNAPTLDGYVLSGWYTDSSLLSPYNFSSSVSGDLILHAGWDPALYTITLMDGETELSQVSFLFGETIDYPDYNIPEGSKLGGWYTDTSFEEEFVDTEMIGQDITLYAKWEAAVYTISYLDFNGEVIQENIFTYGEDITGVTPPPPLDEYGYFFEGFDVVLPETMPDHNLVINSVWSPNEVTVVMVIDNSGDNEHIYGQYLDEVLDLTPLIEGYTFLGWYLDEDYSEEFIFDVMPPEDLTIYALWEVGTYTITFDTAGGSGIDPITALYGSVIFAPEDPLKEGFVFVGWYYDFSVDLTYMPGKDMTLMAVWENDPEYFEAVPTELTTDPITITFWHVYGEHKSALLDHLIIEFEAMYPNITINSISQGTYSYLGSKVILSISSGNTPDLTLGYLEDIAAYNNIGATVPLDGYINSPEFGIDLNNYIEAYIDGSLSAGNGDLNSLPFSKSTEVLIINTSIFEANGITVPTDRYLLYAELEAYAEIMVGDGPNQCEYLINYDSEASYFINGGYMSTGLYLDNFGNTIMDSNLTGVFLDYTKALFNNQTLAIPQAFDDAYGSIAFLQQRTCMTVSNIAGIAYNIPSDGAFEIAYAPIPQIDSNNPSALAFGPELAMLDGGTDQEKLASWLFMTFLTNDENSAAWSLNTGYLPVTEGAYQEDYYQSFINNPDADYAYESAAINATILQKDYTVIDSVYRVSVPGSFRDFIKEEIQGLYTGSFTYEMIIDHIELSEFLSPVDMELDLTDLSIYYDPLNKNILLFPDNYMGFEVTWESLDPEVISNYGEIFRPSPGEGDYIAVVVATIYVGDTMYQKEFYVSVKEEVEYTVYTDVALLHENAELEDGIMFTGIVNEVYSGGYFLFDGVNTINVYNYHSGFEVELGDEVQVIGSYNQYYHLFQISNTTSEIVLSKGNDYYQEPTAVSILDLNNLDPNNKLLFGQTFLITGIVLIDYSSSYIYLVDGDNSIIISASSNIEALDLVRLFEGQEVTIEVVYAYYRDHNGVSVLFSNKDSAYQLSLDDMPEPITILEVISPDMPVDTVVDISGVVVGIVVDTGIQIYDGTGYIYVYTMGTIMFGTEDIQIGDIVNVSGSKTLYYGLTEIINITSISRVSTGNEVPGFVPILITDLFNEDPYDSLYHSLPVTLTGVLELDGQDIYFVGTDSNNDPYRVLVYYRSDESKLAELRFHEGKMVTADVFVFGYHAGYRAWRVTINSNSVIEAFVLTDEQQAIYEVATINIGDLSSIINNVVLHPTTNQGTTITWTTSDANIITDAGIITRVTGTDVTAVLTATITVGSVTVTRDFNVVVKDANILPEAISVSEAITINDGDYIVVEGVISNIVGSYTVLQGPGGESIAIYSSTFINDNALQIGDKIIVHGEKGTYYGVHQLYEVEVVVVISSGNVVLFYTDIPVQELVTAWLGYQGRNIVLTGLVVVEVDDGYGYATLADEFGNEIVLILSSIPYAADLWSVGDVVDLSVVVWDIYYDRYRVFVYEYPELNDQQAVDYVAFLYEIPTSTSIDITLDTIDVDYNVIINWSTSNAVILTIDGVITRPALGEADADVVLTATFIKGAESVTKTYTVTVRAIQPAPTSGLFISEYIEGGGYNKAIELYNSTDTAIDLSSYTLRLYSAGGTTYTELTLSGTIEAGGVFVIANDSADLSELIAETDVFTDFLIHNGDDVYELVKDGEVIDTIGVSGDVDWGQNVTLVRKSSIMVGNATYDPNEWDEYGQDNTDYIGSHFAE